MADVINSGRSLRFSYDYYVSNVGVTPADFTNAAGVVSLSPSDGTSRSVTQLGGTVGVPAALTLTWQTWFSNNFTPKFYGTVGTITWNYDGS